MDLTGAGQHGFKRKRSTAPLSLTIQTIIAAALDDNCDAIMASLDLSAVFDTVNIDLLLKRMTTMGLPSDLVGLVEIKLMRIIRNYTPKHLTLITIKMKLVT